MEIRARPTSLTAMPRRALGVISSRVRGKDHFSISSVSLADLGGKNDRVYRVSPYLERFFGLTGGRCSSSTMTSIAANSTSLGRGPHRSDLNVSRLTPNRFAILRSARYTGVAAGNGSQALWLSAKRTCVRLDCRVLSARSAPRCFRLSYRIPENSDHLIDFGAR